MIDQRNDASRPAGSQRRTVLAGAAMGTAFAALGAREARAAGWPAHPKWKLVFVNHVTTNPFFVPTKYGIEDACAITGCDYQWTGSQTSNAAEMVNAMN